MLITTIEELRLALPTHAMDDISQLTGFIENSEVDFLKEKLGDELYSTLKGKYKEIDVQDYLQKIFNNETLTPWERLLQMCQRCVSFDAMGRAISVQAVSLNNAGINISTSDDYEKVDANTVSAYKTQCNKEAHAGINYLLQSLETMVKESKMYDADSVEGGDYTQNEKDTIYAKMLIAELWKKSRYYFLAGSLLLPSASILQDFVNIYDNREKYIQLLPDLHYVQEEQMAPAIGDDLLEYFVGVSVEGTTNKVLSRIIYKLRKALASGLEARTTILGTKKDRQMQAHDELVGYLKSIAEYIGDHQDELPENAQEALKLSPCYRPPKDNAPKEKAYENKNGNALFATPVMH